MHLSIHFFMESDAPSPDCFLRLSVYRIHVSGLHQKACALTLVIVETSMKLLNIGFGNTVMVERIIAVINTGSSPARKIKELAKQEGKLIDVTEGRRTRSILIMDSNHVVLSSVQSDTITQRMQALHIDAHLAEIERDRK